MATQYQQAYQNQNKGAEYAANMIRMASNVGYNPQAGWKGAATGFAVGQAQKYLSSAVKSGGFKEGFKAAGGATGLATAGIMAGASWYFNKKMYDARGGKYDKLYAKYGVGRTWKPASTWNPATGSSVNGKWQSSPGESNPMTTPAAARQPKYDTADPGDTKYRQLWNPAGATTQEWRQNMISQIAKRSQRSAWSADRIRSAMDAYRYQYNRPTFNYETMQFEQSGAREAPGIEHAGAGRRNLAIQREDAIRSGYNAMEGTAKWQGYMAQLAQFEGADSQAMKDYQANLEKYGDLAKKAVEADNASREAAGAQKAQEQRQAEMMQKQQKKTAINPMTGRAV